MTRHQSEARKAKKLEETRKKHETKQKKYELNNKLHLEKEIKTYGGLEHFLTEKFNHIGDFEFEYKINQNTINIEYEQKKYKIEYSAQKENNITKGIYFKYQDKTSPTYNSNIVHDFELFFYETILKN